MRWERSLATVFGLGRLPAAPGSWASLAALPPAWAIVWVGGPWALGAAALLLGFAAFRLFDIAKPPPIGWIERKVGGGPGVMADDAAAAVCAAALLHLVDWGLGDGVLFR